MSKRSIGISIKWVILVILLVMMTWVIAFNRPAQRNEYRDWVLQQPDK